MSVCVCVCVFVVLFICESVCLCCVVVSEWVSEWLWVCVKCINIIGTSQSEAPHYWVLCIPRYIIYYVYYILCIYIYIYICTTSRLLRMRQMFHVKHGVDAPPTTCMRSPKRKRLRNQCFADINGCSVARSIEVTMVGTLDRSRLPRSVIMAAQVQSTDVFLCYQRLRVSCALCNNFQAARPRQTTERRLAPLYDKS